MLETVAACYTVSVATTQGPSYGFWLRVQQELDRQNLSQRELVARSGVSHTVINNLRHTGIRDRVARRENILDIAKTLGIPEDEALRLGGLTDLPRDPNVDVRNAIRASADLDCDQKAALLNLLDLFDRDRPRRHADQAGND